MLHDLEVVKICRKGVLETIEVNNKLFEDMREQNVEQVKIKHSYNAIRPYEHERGIISRIEDIEKQIREETDKFNE